jgi:aryl-alcohol dehydrogenase-like predicted oxidoreductase
VKLGLGTVRFGLNYGIGNGRGKSSPPEVREILDFAATSGIAMLDTAAGYGDSEDVLGATLPANHEFQIVTKTPVFTGCRNGEEVADELKQALLTSLAKLRKPALYGLLIHHAGDLLAENGERLFAEMQACKDAGLVIKIGVSGYTAVEIEDVLARFPLDLVQLPINVLDQSAIADGRLAAFKRQGLEIHARSVFLQGLLLMPPTEVPAYFDPIRPLLLRYRAAVSEAGLSAVEAAVAFIKTIEEVDCLVVGVSSRSELAEIVAAFGEQREAPFDFSSYAVAEPRFVNPTLWQVSQ